MNTKRFIDNQELDKLQARLSYLPRAWDRTDELKNLKIYDYVIDKRKPINTMCAVFQGLLYVDRTIKGFKEIKAIFFCCDAKKLVWIPVGSSIYEAGAAHEQPPFGFPRVWPGDSVIIIHEQREGLWFPKVHGVNGGCFLPEDTSSIPEGVLLPKI